jgi:hypothetical protein
MSGDQELPTSAVGLLDGYIEDSRVAKERDLSQRAQRAERQRGEGPPYVKIGKKIYYPVDGFRAWLKSIERMPVRARRP